MIEVAVPNNMVPVTEQQKKKKNKNRTIIQAEPVIVADPEIVRSPLENAQLICFFLAIFSLVVYGRSLSNGFVDYDDHQYITDNQHVKSGLSAATIRWSFTSFEAGNWHPLTWISHAFDVQVFGLAPAGHHLDSMFLHMVNVVLLFFLLWKATSARGPSLIVAALFAVHPLNVECVAWAAERKSLLCTVFFFLAIGCYGWFVKRPSVSRYLALTLLFACGLMAKPMVITLPFVLLLLDYWPLQRVDGVPRKDELLATSRESKSLGALVLEKVPLLILCAGSAVITIVAQARSNALMTLTSTPVWLRVENAICSYALYLFKALWPSRLALFYPETAPGLWRVFLSLLILLAISAWVWRERKERPYLIVGWLWYLGTLVPVIGLVQVGSQALADRYAYIPLIGIFVMVVWRLAELCDSLRLSLQWRIALVVLVVLALAVATRRQIGFWRDPLSLWTHSLEITQDNFVAEDNVGFALTGLGRNDEAILHFEKALQLGGEDDPTSDMGLETAYQERDPRKSIEHGVRALTLTKNPKQLVWIYDGLGGAYARVHDYANSGSSFRQALRLDPSNQVAMSALGNVLLRQTAQRISSNLEQHPAADGFSQLGSIWEQTGEYGSAKQAYQAALKLNPKLTSAQEGLDRVTKKTTESQSSISIQ